MEHPKNLSLGEVAAHFLAGLPHQETRESQQELSKFVRWCGRDRPIGELTGHEVAGYAEGMGESIAGFTTKLEPVKGFLTYAKKEGYTQTNLALHLRVRKGATKGKSPPRRSSQGLVQLTPEGHARLQAELDSLKGERMGIAEELRKAMADKDFRENAPLDAAREHQGKVEARIRELEATLQAAVVLDQEQENSLKVELGARVTLLDLARGEELSYTLVYPHEVNPLEGKFSVASPVGKALLGRVRGEEVEIVAPVGTFRYRIEKIER